MKTAKVRRNEFLFWQADVEAVESSFTWKFHIRNEDAARRMFPIYIPEESDFAVAYSRAKFPEDYEEGLRRVTEALRNGLAEYQHEYRLSTKDGQTIYIHEACSIVPTGPGRWNLQGVCSDVTEQQNSRLAVLRDMHRYQYLFEENPLPIWVVDPKSLRFLFVNKAATSFYGYTRDEFLKMTLLDIRPAEDKLEFAAFARSNQEQPIIRGVWRHLHKDGRVIYAEVTSCEVADPSEGATSMRLSIMNDVSDRVRAERELVRSEKDLAFAQQIASIGSWSFDYDSGQLYVSDQFYRLAGCDPAVSVPSIDWLQNCFDVAPDNPMCLRNRIASPPKELAKVELDIKRPNGEKRTVLNRVSTVFHGDGTPSKLFGTVQDITDQIKVDEELRQKNALLEAIVDSTPDGHLVVGYDGKKLLQSRQFTDLHQIPQDVASLEDESVQLEHVLARTQNGSEIREAMEGLIAHPTKRGRLELQLGSGRVLDIITSPVVGSEGQQYGRLWVARDCTDEYKLAEALRESEASLRTLVESIPNHVWVATSDGNNTYTNDRWVEYTGMSREDSSGFGYLAASHPDDRDAAFAHAVNAFKFGRPIHYECRIRRKDGIYRWFLIRGDAIRDENGNTVKWIGTCTDIHDRRMNEEELERRVAERTSELEASNVELRQAKSAAEVADRAKSEFLSRMSHEFRTPLNAILGFGQLIGMQDLRTDREESVSLILKGGRQLLNLVDEILDVSKLDVGQLELRFERVSIATVIDDVFKAMKSMAEDRGVSLTYEKCCADQCHVVADYSRLKQAIQSLVLNAILYNDPGGTVTVQCDRPSESRVQISVRDTGWGIKSDDLERLFLPFERLSGPELGVDGAGLGLVLARRLIHAMHGTIDVRSELGKGSTFTIEMNLSHEESDRSDSDFDGGAPSVSGSTGRPKILCIEDNLSNLKLFEAIMRSRPQYELVTAVLGTVGLEMARQDPPDLILLDLHLPDIHGHDVCLKLQEDPLTSRIPVVVISADATQGQKSRLLSVGVREYLTKPLVVAEFLRVLDHFLHSPIRK